MTKKNLEQWLSYWESNHPTEIDMGLDRVREVAKRLNLFKPTPLVLLVAGTNGKGSTVTMVSEMLRETGLSVGCYMSPHLHVYNERVRVNGELASDADIVESFEAIEDARKEISLTYFEVGTLSALYIFKQKKLDACVLEIGLGGRLDAVNIVDADGAAVTSIGLDHQDWLGSDIEQIAFEKAGVYRTGKIAVCGERVPAKTLVDHAENIKAPLLIKGRDFDFSKSKQGWGWSGKNLKGCAIQFEDLPVPSLPLENAATAIQLIVNIKPEITQQQISNGLARAKLDGRLQIFSAPYQGVMDVGHNPQAAKLLNDYLKQNPVSGQNYGVLAMLADKDANAVVNEMTQIQSWKIAGLDGYRGQSSKTLLDKLGDISNATQSESVAIALADLEQLVKPEDRVVVFGSFITVALAQDWLGAKQEEV